MDMMVDDKQCYLCGGTELNKRLGRVRDRPLQPVSYEKDHDESEYFEWVAEDGTLYRLKDWTDEEFNKASMVSACKDDDTRAEDIFDV